MYLTIKQAAQRLQVSTKTIFRRIEDGSLSCIQLGARTIRIEEEELQRYVNSHKREKVQEHELNN